MPKPERTSGTNPEIPSKKAEPIKPEYSADLMEELEATPSMVEEEHVIPPERPKSTAERAVDNLYDELGQAKIDRHLAPDGTVLAVFPEERIALAVDVRSRAQKLADILKKTGAETGSTKEQMELERAEIAAEDAEALALTLSSIYGVSETSPAVQEKLLKIKAEADVRESELTEQANRNAAVQEQKRAEMYATLRAQSAQERPSAVEFSPSMEKEINGAVQEGTQAGIRPMEYVEDQDIIESAEDFDEMSEELAGPEAEFAALQDEAVPDRVARLQKVLDAAEQLSMRTAEAGNAEQDNTPRKKALIDLDFRATQLLLRTREQLKKAGVDQDTKFDVVRPVRDSQIIGEVEPSLTEKTVVTPDNATRIAETIDEPAEDTVFAPVSEIGSIDLAGSTKEESAPEPTIVNRAAAAMTENASAEMTAMDQGDELIATQGEPKTVVTPRVPEASILSNEPTRLSPIKAEKTVVTAPPTLEEPPTDLDKAA
jgi:hypothetical protein